MRNLTAGSLVTPETATVLHNQIESYLDEDLFSLVIQPTVNFRTGCTYTGEALSRLNHPEYGIISADVFIPTLDTLGLYSKFDQYIFRKCCVWLYHTAAKGKRFDWISCNFSRKTLSQTGIVQDLIQIADSYKIPHCKLGIEITEWNQATDMQQISENLRQLKAAGFRIILDDYGSGVTHERDLYNFPLDIVKLDHSLLLNTGTEEGDTAFRALVDKFLQLGVEIICEGIETEVHDNLAQETGCHYGQGFLYFKPLSADRVSELLQEEG